MKVTLYQIANDLDTKRLMFFNLEFFQKIVGNQIPAEIYGFELLPAAADGTQREERH